MRAKKKLIILVTSLHFLGVITAFFTGGKKVDNLNLFLHLIRFLSWWSVHTSILTIWAAILIRKQSQKKSPSYFSQFLTLLATIYNLITFFFWNYCLLFLREGMWERFWFLNILSVLWHFVAPLTTLFYFYLYGKVDRLIQKIVRTLFLIIISPIFYFFYVYVLAKIHHPTSSLFPYTDRYPYRIFEWIADRKWEYFIINFLTACLVFLSLAGLIIWTKFIYEKKRKQRFKKIGHK